MQVIDARYSSRRFCLLGTIAVLPYRCPLTSLSLQVRIHLLVLLRGLCGAADLAGRGSTPRAAH